MSLCDAPSSNALLSEGLVMPRPPKSLPPQPTEPNPRRWLRLRPTRRDTPAEYIHDFSHWAVRVLEQGDHNWHELEYFLRRAVRLNGCHGDEGSSDA